MSDLSAVIKSIKHFQAEMDTLAHHTLQYRQYVCPECGEVVPATRGDNPQASQEAKAKGEHWIIIDHAIGGRYCQGSYKEPKTHDQTST
jgi:hypothetical protein